MKKPLCLGAAAVCFALAALFKFAFAGYAASALLFGGLGLVILFYTLTAGWKARTAGPLRTAVTVFLLLGCGCFAAAEIPIAAGARSDADPQADYLIVMGAGVNGTEPSLSLQERLEAALSYLDANPQTAAVVSGCRGENETVSEASVMARWLEERGVDASRILVEDQARSSYENLLYSQKLIAADGGDPAGRIAVVSSEYHLYRIRLLARALGFEPVCVAARTARLSLRLNYFLREAFGVWRVWVLGPG